MTVLNEETEKLSKDTQSKHITVPMKSRSLDFEIRCVAYRFRPSHFATIPECENKVNTKKTFFSPITIVFTDEDRNN